MKKYGGVITNWQIHNLSFTKDQIEEAYPGRGGQPMVFTGTVVECSHRWKNGYHMRSSLIVKVDRENEEIETMNTIYNVINEGNDVFSDIGDAAMNIFY